MKFHAIIHMANDILLYGVPKEHDTGSNESGHKVTKVAARLTQKNMATFELQTAIRLLEFMVIQWAMAELDGLRLWEYYGDYDPMDVDDDDGGEDEDEDSDNNDANAENQQGGDAANDKGSNGDSDDSDANADRKEDSDGEESEPNADREEGSDGDESEPKTWTGGRMLEVYWANEETKAIGFKGRTKAAKRSPALATDRYSQEVVEFLLELEGILGESGGLVEVGVDAAAGEDDWSPRRRNDSYCIVDVFAARSPGSRVG